MLDRTKKNKVIRKFQTHTGDTGSPQVQIAILTEEIKELQDHLKIHRKDNSSRRGMLRKVNQRRRLLNYLMRGDDKAYEEVITALKLRRRISQAEEIRQKIASEAEEPVEEPIADLEAVVKE